MQIRLAQLEDIEALFEIRTSVVENHQSREELAELGVTPETIAEMLKTNCRAWIAEINEYPIGFAMANAAEYTIFALFVRPGYEGQGAGRQLMQQAEDWLWAEGAEQICLFTGNNPQLRAYGFYQHLGWAPTNEATGRQIKFIKQRA